MIVYYTNNYDKNKKTSHELLETAIAKLLSEREAVSGAEADGAERAKSRLWNAEALSLETDADGALVDVDESAKALVAEIYECTEYGKPAINGFCEFSISHSGSSWAVLIDEKSVHRENSKAEAGPAASQVESRHTADQENAASAGCGLDMQYIKDAGVETVCKRYYTEEEQAAVASLGKSEFFRLWARREALVKTVGTTIVNRGLPSVLEDKVLFEGREWIVKDLTIPGLEGACAAIVYSDRDADEEVKYVEIA